MNLQEAQRGLEALPEIRSVKIRVLHDVTIDIYINKEPVPLGKSALEVIADIHCGQATLFSSKTLQRIWAIADAVERGMARQLSRTLDIYKEV